MPTFTEIKSTVDRLISNGSLDHEDESILDNGFMEDNEEHVHEFEAARQVANETVSDRLRKVNNLIIKSQYNKELYKQMSIGQLTLCFKQLPQPYTSYYPRVCLLDGCDYEAVLRFYQVQGRRSTMPYIVHKYDINRAETIAILRNYRRQEYDAKFIINELKAIDWCPWQRLHGVSGYGPTEATSIIVRFGFRKRFTSFIKNHTVGKYPATLATFELLYMRHVDGRDDNGSEETRNIHNTQG